MVRLSYTDRQQVPELDYPMSETEQRVLDSLYEGPQTRIRAKVVNVSVPDTDRSVPVIEDDDGER